MSITLHPRIEAYLCARVTSGGFSSISEAANELLGELADTDGMGDNLDVSALREILRRAIEQADRGESVDFDVESTIRHASTIRAGHSACPWTDDSTKGLSN